MILEWRKDQVDSEKFKTIISYDNPKVENIPELTIHAEGKLGMDGDKLIFVEGSFLKSKDE